MQHHSILLGAAVLALAFGATPLAAQQSAASRPLDLDVSIRAGTLGIGVEAGKLITNRIATRVGMNFGGYNLAHTQDEIMYSADLKLQGVTALVDLFPWSRGRFHFTGGYVTSPLKVTAVGEPSSSGTYEIDGTTYTSDEVGSLVAEAQFASGPYVGIGFGTPAKNRGPLRFKFDVGAVIGKASLSLRATGAVANTDLVNDLEAQRLKSQESLDKFAKVYPVIAIGIGFGI